MATKKNSKSAQQPDFVLKHRIAGAAFLLFFGALFLPWLLGPPSEAVKIPDQQLNETGAGQEMIDIEDDLLAAIENEEVSDQERVYISKITPLDNERATSGAEQSEAAPATNSSAAEQSSKKDAPQPREQAASPSATPQETAGSNSSAPEPEDTPAPADTTAANTAGNQASAGTALAAGEQVDVGWVVQVGVFTDKRGAARVVKDLRDKGFDPSTTIVDTNRGKATGTRIWLGPYAQRVNAAKAKSLLTSKTGEAGFIRAYP